MTTDCNGTARPYLKILFMKYLDPSADLTLVPVVLSVHPQTAQLLNEMSRELGVSIDELVSSIAEDSVTELEKPIEFMETVLPDKCSLEQLRKLLGTQ